MTVMRLMNQGHPVISRPVAEAHHQVEGAHHQALVEAHHPAEGALRQAAEAHHQALDEAPHRPLDQEAHPQGKRSDSYLRAVGPGDRRLEGGSKDGEAWIGQHLYCASS